MCVVCVCVCVCCVCVCVCVCARARFCLCVRARGGVQQMAQQPPAGYPPMQQQAGYAPEQAGYPPMQPQVSLPDRHPSPAAQ